MDPDPTSPAAAAADGSSLGVREGRLARLMRIERDPGHRGPAPPRWALATAASLAGSLLADEALIHACRALWPATAGFSHFRPADFVTLTVIGVVAASAGWAVVARISAAPRYVYLRLAAAVTLLLWLPDGWLLAEGRSGAAVATLMLMHLAVAVVTYTCMVRLAPLRARESGAGGAGSGLTPQTVRQAWTTMAALVGLDLALGVVTIVVVPFHRPDALVPARGAVVYTIHAGLGLVVGVGALGSLAVAPRVGRIARLGAVTGAVGVALGGIGGVLAVFQHLRFGGMALMMVGSLVAGFGYLLPALEAFGEAEQARAGLSGAAATEGAEPGSGAGPEGVPGA